MHDEFGQLSGLLGNLSNASGRVLPDLRVHIFEAVQNPWEDLSLDDDFGQVDGVLGDLSEALADVSLELSIWVRDESSQVGNGTLVDDSLGQLLSVLGNLTESSGRDSLEGQLWLLNAENEKANSSSVNDGLSQLVVVLGNAGKSEGSSLLDTGIELLEANDESVEGARVHDGLGQVRRVLGNRPEDVSGRLFVETLENSQQYLNTYVLLGEGVDELWEDLVGHDGLSQLVRVGGESAKSQGGRLLDRGHIVEEKRSQERHNTCNRQIQIQTNKRDKSHQSGNGLLTGTLESLNVLGSLSELSDGLNEGNTSLLVGFEGSKDSTRHVEGL